MKKLYLTIDDSPSLYTDEVTDFLAAEKIPAVLFARGALMEEKEAFDRIVRAAQKGFIIGNHSYAHERTSLIGFESQTQQILTTQTLIDRAYDEAGVAKPSRYFRFPHLDRGCGNAWVIDFNTVPDAERGAVQNLFWDGVRLETRESPTPAQLELKLRMQHWLIANGFQKLPVPEVTFPWWQKSELGQAVDSLITYSSADWMLLARHRGKWPYASFAELTRKIDTDPWLQNEESASIALMHDYGEEDSLTLFKNLVKHFLNQDFRFLTF
ncbi:MAG: polysaccharide deacetylase family protein [Pseudobdellovibrionaceae bacterium]